MRINIYWTLFHKLCSMLFKIKHCSKKSKEYIKFEKIFSGCFLDIQIICCCRFIILYSSNRWSIVKATYFTKNCKFEFSEAFKMNLSPTLFIIFINVIILLIFFFLMVKKKKKIIFYIGYRWSFINIFSLFSLHFLFELSFQMFTNGLA